MGFVTDLFGGEKSSSSNQAYPFLQNALGGVVGTGGKANTAQADALGLNGTGASQQGFQNFLNSTGEQFTLDQGSKAITGNAAARGLLNSGSTLKALQGFGQQTGQQYFQNYLSNLNALSGQGIQGAGVISDAGKVSSGSKNGGLLGGIGSLAGTAALFV